MSATVERMKDYRNQIKNDTITTAISSEAKKEVKKMAKKLGMHFTVFVREAIIEKLEKSNNL